MERSVLGRLLDEVGDQELDCWDVLPGGKSKSISTLILTFCTPLQALDRDPPYAG